MKIINADKLKAFLEKRYKQNKDADDKITNKIHPLSYQYKTAYDTFAEVLEWIEEKGVDLE